MSKVVATFFSNNIPVKNIQMQDLQLNNLKQFGYESYCISVFDNHDDIIYEGQYLDDLKNGLHVSYSAGIIEKHEYYINNEKAPLPLNKDLKLRILKNDISGVKKIIELSPGLINEAPPLLNLSNIKERGHSFLELAISKNHNDIVQHLLDNGYDCSRKENQNCLQTCIKSNNNTAFKLIYSRYPDLLNEKHKKLIKECLDKITHTQTFVDNASKILKI
jgi:hypothetical protein